MEAYSIEKKTDEFSEADKAYSMIVQVMRSLAESGAEHAEVESRLRTDGDDLLRKLLQGHFDLRASQEEKLPSVTDASGRTLTHRRENCTRVLASIFGEVTVRRIGYSIPFCESVFPQDAALNLPPDKYSHGLRKIVGAEAAKGSFDETVTLVSAMTSGAIPKRQAEELTSKLVQDFESFYAQRCGLESGSLAGFLVLSVDGKGIVMNEKSLREATRIAAEKAQETRPHRCRLSPGEKSNRKRMATVATVYSIDPFHRSAEEILHLGVEDSNAAKRPKPTQKRVWASIEKSAESLIDEIFDEAARRDPNRLRHWVMLLDGAPQQLALVKKAARKHKASVTIVLDFIHVTEYVWTAAHCFFEVGSKDAEVWVKEKLLEILKGKAGVVAGAMRRKATKLGLDKNKRKGVDDCARYMKKRRNLMRYDDCLSLGMPIATGVIEGACRYLVKDRMDITGARWGLKTAEAVLKLRAMHASRELDDYWVFHREHEKNRNYPAATGKPFLKVVK